MKSLFLRIFLSFWMAQALFVVLAILVTMAFRPRSSTWEALRTTVLNDAVTSYEEGGAPQAAAISGKLEATQHVRAYLFDEHGNEVSQRGAPDWAMRVALADPCTAEWISISRAAGACGTHVLRPTGSIATRSF